MRGIFNITGRVSTTPYVQDIFINTFNLLTKIVTTIKFCTATQDSSPSLAKLYSIFCPVIRSSFSVKTGKPMSCLVESYFSANELFVESIKPSAVTRFLFQSTVIFPASRVIVLYSIFACRLIL